MRAFGREGCQWSQAKQELAIDLLKAWLMHEAKRRLGLDLT